MIKSILLFCFYLVPFSLFSQGSLDSIIYEDYKSKLARVKSASRSYRSDFQNANNVFNTNFCDINFKSKKLGDNILDFYFELHDLHRFETQNFLCTKYNCFTQKQQIKIKNWLSSNLLESDILFFKLVGIYGVSKFKSYLIFNSGEKWYNEILSEFKSKNKISELLIFKLKCVSTLVNLGSSQLEPKLYQLMIELYEIAKLKESQEMWVNLYNVILLNSIATLNTKSSVRNTIFMLDNDRISYDGHGSGGYYAQTYFYSVVQHKIIDGELSVLAANDFINNKSKIIEKLLNDETIWNPKLKQ